MTSDGTAILKSDLSSREGGEASQRAAFEMRENNIGQVRLLIKENTERANDVRVILNNNKQPIVMESSRKKIKKRTRGKEKNERKGKITKKWIQKEGKEKKKKEFV